MRTRFIRIETTSKLERHDTIDLVKDLLSRGGAWVIDFKMFSNNILTIQFAITAEDIHKLQEALNQTALLVHEESTQQLDELAAEVELASEREKLKELNGGFVVHFIHNDPDLIIEVPAVPG